MKARITEIATVGELEHALELSHQQPVLLFKHSTSCGLSTRAHRQIDKLTEPNDPAVFRVVVQRARVVSDDIESRFGVRHESPQVFIVDKGDAAFDASHHRVTTENIRTAVESVVKTK